jgi:hypothetical protein
MGLVEVVEHLSTVQDKVYEEPTVLVVHNVTGAALGFRFFISILGLATRVQHLLYVA